MSVLGITKGPYEPCKDSLKRSVRGVIIAGVQFRQYRWPGTGYCLELIEDPSRNSGWCKHEYQSMSWGRQFVLDRREGKR
ncbi:MAG: hypothetical protein K1X67_07840 [Fimbriimonadaceae bacterium]|nr:hypothetical protein [Fimbriimonadaceae bacterium]